MDIPGTKPQPIHCGKMSNGITHVAVHHQLRLGCGARCKIELQGIGPIGFPIGTKLAGMRIAVLIRVPSRNGFSDRDTGAGTNKSLTFFGIFACGNKIADPAAFDPVTALFPVDVIAFIRDSQPARWAQLEAMLKDQTAATVIDTMPMAIPMR